MRIMDKVTFLRKISEKVVLCDTSILDIPVEFLLTDKMDALTAMSQMKHGPYYPLACTSYM